MILAFLLAIGMPNVPGATNPNINQNNIKTTICVSGWTGTVRPPASYTNKLKLSQMKTLGLKGLPKDYEEDHLISLEIGGNPTDPNNLWPEPWNGPWNAHDKDRLENALKKDVCSGKETLSEVQKTISTNWQAEYLRRFGKPKSIN